MVAGSLNLNFERRGSCSSALGLSHGVLISCERAIHLHSLDSFDMGSFGVIVFLSVILPLARMRASTPSSQPHAHVHRLGLS